MGRQNSSKMALRLGIGFMLIALPPSSYLLATITGLMRDNPTEIDLAYAIVAGSAIVAALSIYSQLILKRIELSSDKSIRSSKAAKLAVVIAIVAFIPAFVLVALYKGCLVKDDDVIIAYMALSGGLMIGLINAAGQAWLKWIEWSTDEPKAPSAPAAPTQGSQVAYLTFAGFAIIGLITIAGQAFPKGAKRSSDKPNATTSARRGR